MEVLRFGRGVGIAVADFGAAEFCLEGTDSVMGDSSDSAGVAGSVGKAEEGGIVSTTSFSCCEA